MLGITHMRHISLITPLLKEQADFYEKVWGLEKVFEDDSSVYFRGEGPEHHILSLHSGNRTGLHHAAFGMRDKQAVDRAAETLAAKEVPIVQEPGYLDEAGGGYGFRIVDPENRCIEFSTWVEVHSGGDWKQKSVNPMKLNHIVFNTTDLHGTAAFYTDILGFKVSDWSEDQMVFLRVTDSHHQIALNRASFTSMNHIAYELNSIDELMRGMKNVREAGLKELWGPGRHGPGDNVFCYFKDPAGYTTEYTCYLSKIDENYQPRVWKRVPHLMDQWGIAGPATPEIRAVLAGKPDPGWVDREKLQRRVIV